MLSRFMLITDRRLMKPNFNSALLAALQGGAKWIQLREKDLPPRELLALFTKATRLTEKFGAQLFLNGRSDLARAAHADGLHLPESEIAPREAQLTLGFHVPIGVSVHSLETALRARDEGANYLVFGPIFSTQSHPETAPAGLEALEKVTKTVGIPVLAVGGITAPRVARCLEAGAYGVAAIRAIWDAPEIGAATREFVEATGQVASNARHK